jgi:hypothetical protein
MVKETNGTTPGWTHVSASSRVRPSGMFPPAGQTACKGKINCTTEDQVANGVRTAGLHGLPARQGGP